VSGDYRFGTFLNIGVGRDADDGWKRIRDGLLQVRGAYAMWGSGRTDVSNARDFAAQWEDAVREGALCGSPQQIVDALAPHVQELDSLGFADVFISAILAPPGTPFDAAAEAIETFGSQIIPALKG
jgi:hypothetical protein